MPNTTEVKQFPRWDCNRTKFKVNQGRLKNRASYCLPQSIWVIKSYFICVFFFQDVLHNDSLSLDWVFKMSIASDIARVCRHFQTLLLLYLASHIWIISTVSSDYFLLRLSTSNVPALGKALFQWSGFEMTVENPVSNYPLRPITTRANSVMNQSDFLAITCSLLTARERSRVQGAIGHGLPLFLIGWKTGARPFSQSLSVAIAIAWLLLTSSNAISLKPTSVTTTKCPRPHLVHFAITSDEKYEQ